MFIDTSGKVFNHQVKKIIILAAYDKYHSLNYISYVILQPLNLYPNMNLKTIVSVFLLLTILPISSQEALLLYETIPAELLENANAVVRNDMIEFEIISYDKIIYRNKRIVTIVNSSGNKKVGATVGYDNHTNVKKLEARVYDRYGKELKRIKKKDFQDVSAVDGATLYSDSRVKYLRYTPIVYPYTVVFETEIELNSTAFIYGWRPIEGYHSSTENASYRIINDTDVEIKLKTSNFDGYNIDIGTDENHFIAKNLKAIEPEAYSPSFRSFAPFLRASLAKFKMDGVDGTNTDWNDFGKWVNDKLLSDALALPASVVAEIKEHTKDASTNLEKAKLVYEYMQNKTRYISVQVGIGGWKPIAADQVNMLGYGDCKGLSNLTKALLNAVGVESYYTVLFGGNDIRGYDKDFSIPMGNHAILCIPDGEDYVWLECTSQTNPFGYIANFTDDRDAFIVTPEGGKIVHTKAYETSKNLQHTKAKINLNSDGSFYSEIVIKSMGTQYGYHEGLQNKELKDQKLYYKNYWDHINNLELASMKYLNDKDSIVFTENVNAKATNYTSKAGEIILLNPNFFNRISSTPPRYRSRKLPVEVSRGFTDIDEYEIILPEGHMLDAKGEDVNISNQFGEYEFSINTEGNKLIVYRKFVLNKGVYQKEDYAAFRKFWMAIVKQDKSKIAIKPTQP